MKIIKKRLLEQKRRWRVRRKVSGTVERPRLAVHFSNKHIYAQCINDESGTTLVSLSTLDKALRSDKNAANVEGATCGVGLDKLEDFRRGDAAIPGRGAEISQVELEAAQKIHFSESRTFCGSNEPMLRQTSLPCASKKIKVGVNSKPYTGARSMPTVS